MNEQVWLDKIGHLITSNLQFQNCNHGLDNALPVEICGLFDEQLFALLKQDFKRKRFEGFSLETKNYVTLLLDILKQSVDDEKLLIRTYILAHLVEEPNPAFHLWVAKHVADPNYDYFMN